MFSCKYSFIFAIWSLWTPVDSMVPLPELPPTTPTNFFQFGPGLTPPDSVILNAEPSFQEITIPGSCFSYFGQCETTVFILNNGALSFRQREDSETPDPFPTRSLSGPFIGAYWTDVEHSRGGTIHYRTAETGSDPIGDLPVISQAISDAFDSTDTVTFAATWALVVTYENVPQDDGPILGNNFQIVIAQDGNMNSFAVFNYGDMEWSLSRNSMSYNDAVIGFDAGTDTFSQTNRGAHFNVPNVGSGTPDVLNIASKTNTRDNVCGRLVFRINAAEITQPCLAQSCDGAIDCGMNGMAVCSLSGPICECDEGFTGQFCQESVDDCVGVNCNFGTCVDGDNEFSCTCLDGFQGDACDVNTDDCAGADCGDGSCIDGIDTFTCVCPAGFNGDNCQTNIDECEGVDCGNGACMDGINTFSCSCNPGFTGQFCQDSIDYCAGVDCNFGRCIDGDNTFTCQCLPGFSGDACNENIDDCENVECGEGGACIDGIDSFTCCCEDANTADTCMEPESSESSSNESGSESQGPTNKGSKNKGSKKKNRRRRK